MICFPFLFYSGFVNGFLLKWSSIQLAFFFLFGFLFASSQVYGGFICNFWDFGLFFLVVCLFSSVEVSYSGNVVVVVLV